MFTRDGIVVPEDLHKTLMLNRIHDEVADIGTDNLHHTHMWCISIPVFVKAPAGSNAILFYVEGLANYL